MRLTLGAGVPFTAGEQNVSWAVLVWEDPPGALWSAGNPTKVIIPKAGLYLVTANFRRNTSTASMNFSARLRVNGVDVDRTIVPATTVGTAFSMAQLIELEVDDELVWSVNVHSGAGTTELSGLSWVALTRVGPVRYT